MLWRQVGQNSHVGHNQNYTENVQQLLDDIILSLNTKLVIYRKPLKGQYTQITRKHLLIYLQWSSEISVSMPVKWR